MKKINTKISFLKKYILFLFYNLIGFRYFMLEIHARANRSRSFGFDMYTLCYRDNQKSSSISSINTGGLSKRVVYFPGYWPKALMKLIKEKNDGAYIENFRLVPLRKKKAILIIEKRLRLSLKGLECKATNKNLSAHDLLLMLYDISFSMLDDNTYKVWLRYVDCESFTKVKEGSSVKKILEESYGSILRNTLKQNPLAVITYADSDCLNDNGDRIRPFFKKDWDLDMFFSIDYITIDCIYSEEWYFEHQVIFNQMGKHAALTYLLPKLRPTQILHIPKVLFHHNDKINENFSIIHQKRKVALLTLAKEMNFHVGDGLLKNSYRITYPLPGPAPLVTLLIPTRDNLDVLVPCVQSILDKTAYTHYEILILDNQSRQPETLRWFAEIRQDFQVTVIPYNHPFNYSSINNFGVQHAKGNIIGLINNDIEVISSDWLTEMVSHACRSEIGCVGAKLYYSNGQIQHAGIILSEHNIAMHGHRYFDADADGYQGRLKLVQNYSAVTGACLLVRKEIYEQVGGLNEEHLAVAYNDVDFCLKVREAGYRNLWTPYAELYHHESMSRGSDDTPKKRKRLKKEAAYMRKRWGKELANDPCYNPNLTQLKEDFSLRIF